MDREERPDLDEIYMSATVALSGQRGLADDGVSELPIKQPFFAGTYFPPDETVGGMIGFRQLLGRIAEAWQEGAVR